MKKPWFIPFCFVLWCGAAGAPQFYPDDPLLREPKLRDVGELKTRKLSDVYDLFRNTLATPGEVPKDGNKSVPARGINSLGDPMDGAWWARRHYWKRLTTDELKRGAGSNTPPAEGPLTVVSAKSEGVTPGFVIVDAEKRTYFVKFDSPGHAELATAAEIISSKLFHALGYHVPDNYIVHFSPDRLQLAPEVKLKDDHGHDRAMLPEDLSGLLRRAAKAPDGTIRAIASLALPGRPIGPYRYNGTRSDDPNDIVPHEHRRDLRGMRVAAAWIDHDDSRAINTLDTLVQDNGLRYIRHHQQDFGSTLGSATYKPNSPRSGGEYLFNWKSAAVNFATLGFYVPEWARASYPDMPSVGRFESAHFNPAKWVPEYPNPAFINALPDDDFWMAKQIMSLTDQDIQAIVETGQYSEPRATAYVAACLVARRDKIGRFAYSRLLPLDNFSVSSGRLNWQDLSERFGGAGPIQIIWARFDNMTRQRFPLPAPASSALPAQMTDGYWVASLIQERQPERRVSVYLRKAGSAVDVVGVERHW